MLVLLTSVTYAETDYIYNGLQKLKIDITYSDEIDTPYQGQLKFYLTDNAKNRGLGLERIPVKDYTKPIKGTKEIIDNTKLNVLEKALVKVGAKVPEKAIELVENVTIDYDKKEYFLGTYVEIPKRVGVWHIGPNSTVVTITEVTNWRSKPNSTVGPSVIPDNPLLPESLRPLTVAYYHISQDDDNGTHIVDRSGEGNTGVLSGAFRNYSWLECYGANDELVGTDQDYFSPVNNNVTVSMWVKIRSFDSNSALTSKATGGNYEWEIIAETSQSVSARMYTLAGGFAGQASSTALNLNEYYHILAIYQKQSNGVNASIYVNGEFKNSKLNSSPLGAGSGKVALCERQDAQNDANITIDEVAIFNISLTQDNITDIYNSGARFFNKSGYSAPIIKPTDDVARFLFNYTPEGNNVCNYQWELVPANRTFSDITMANQSHETGGVACYNFDYFNDTTDSCGSNDGVNNGATSIRYNNYSSNGYMEFDGFNDYINGSYINLSNGVTMGGWIYPREYKNQIPFGNLGRANSDLSGINFKLRSDGYLWVLIGESLGTFCGYTTDTISYELNQWQHILVTYNLTEAIIYKNGVQQQTLTCTLDLNNTDPFQIGKDLSATEFFNGSIDEYYLHNRSLSQSEINTLYETTRPPSLVFRPGFNQSNEDGSSRCLKYFDDVSGVYPTLSGGIGCPSNRDSPGPGPYSNSTEFDEVDDFIAYSYNPLGEQQNRELTLSLWFKTNKVDLQGLIGDRISTSDENWTQLWIANTNLAWGCKNETEEQLTSSSNININQWYHAAVTYNASGMFIYLDGQLAGSTTKDCTFSRINDYDLRLGVYFSSQRLNGSITDPAIYNRALEPDEILQLFNDKATFPDENGTLRDRDGNITIYDYTGTDAEYEYLLSNYTLHQSNASNFCSLNSYYSESDTTGIFSKSDYIIRHFKGFVDEYYKYMYLIRVTGSGIARVQIEDMLNRFQNKHQTTMSINPDSLRLYALSPNGQCVDQDTNTTWCDGMAVSIE